MTHETTIRIAISIPSPRSTGTSWGAQVAKVNMGRLVLSGIEKWGRDSDGGPRIQTPGMTEEEFDTFAVAVKQAFALDRRAREFLAELGAPGQVSEDA